MLELIKRREEFVGGYREYCEELYSHNVVFFRPTDPKFIDAEWFSRTKEWYDKKEKGLIEGQPVSFHYWAVDGKRFIGEFQLRTEFSEKVLSDIGSVGYAVRVSEWGKGYGTDILRQGLVIAKEHGLDRVLLNINENNAVSIHICEKLGGKLWDRIEAYNVSEGKHILRRYWIDISGS